MGLNRFIFKGFLIATLALLPFAADGLHSAAAKHAGGLKGHQIKTLMADMRIQPLESVEFPEFTLPDIQGKKFNSKNYPGKVLLINFWTTH